LYTSHHTHQYLVFTRDGKPNYSLPRSEVEGFRPGSLGRALGTPLIGLHLLMGLLEMLLPWITMGRHSWSPELFRTGGCLSAYGYFIHLCVNNMLVLQGSSYLRAAGCPVVFACLRKDATRTTTCFFGTLNHHISSHAVITSTPHALAFISSYGWHPPSWLISGYRPPHLTKLRPRRRLLCQPPIPPSSPGSPAFDDC
jgi:hypothetical protein